MWRYIQGVSKPENKEKRAREPYFKEYEEKRSRSFNKKWTTDYPWLEDSESGMTCTLCLKYDISCSNFTKGCTS